MELDPDALPDLLLDARGLELDLGKVLDVRP
jgi:hypothetical protein